MPVTPESVRHERCIGIDTSAKSPQLQHRTHAHNLEPRVLAQKTPTSGVASASASVSPQSIRSPHDYNTNSPGNDIRFVSASEGYLPSVAHTSILNDV